MLVSVMKEYIAVDLETTGLVPLADQIIEIGAVKVVEGKVVDTFSQLINPHRKLPESVKLLTQIDDAMLRGAGEEAEVLHDFIEFAGTDCIVGHNIMFDYRFLRVASKRHKHGFERKGIDTLLLSRHFHPELEKKNLQNMCEFYQLQIKQFHRAFQDAMAAALLYESLNNEFFHREPKAFEPKFLQYKERKIEPITKIQKKILIDLIKYHRIEFNPSIELLTKSEASRHIDKIILEKGRIV